MATSVHPIDRRKGVLLWRALALRCPNCGSRGIFASWFTLRERCPRCGLRLERGESDYFIGAYLLNLVAIEILLALAIFIVIIATWPDPPWTLLQYGGGLLMAAGAFLCYPFSKTTWLAIDLMFRPLTPEELAWHHEGGREGDRPLPHL
jgi:uncharacterized protein (DUF983 family)